MKDTPFATPENGVDADPVTEQFVSADRGQMQTPKTVRGIPEFLYRLFTKIEQVMNTKKPDKIIGD